MTTSHDLMVITSVQGYCSCGQWGMATDRGIDRLRELHASHAITSPASECRCPREWITAGGGCQCTFSPALNGGQSDA